MPQIPDPQDTSDAVRTCLNLLPRQATERILSRLKEAINYEPVIGIMGKSGAGKSSLCNALFQQPVCLTSDLLGCTREPQRLLLTVGECSMTLVDLPGVGETPEYDEEYLALYKALLVELDLIIWVLRADDRARATDITAYRALMEAGADPSRFLFVLTQADRIPPSGMVNPGRHHLLLSNAFHWLQSVRRLPVSCRPLSRSWLSLHIPAITCPPWWS